MTHPQGTRAAAFDLESLPENVSDAITVFDANWRFVYVNRACELMVHKSREEMLGRVFGEVFPDTVGTIFDLNYRQAMKTQSAVSFEGHYAPLDLWLEVRAYPSPDRLTIFLRIINKRKAAERALLQSEERFRGVFEAAPLGLTIVNSRTHQLLKVNAAMTRILGYSAQELTCLRFDDFTHPDDLATSCEATGKIAAGLSSSQELVKRYIKKDGAVIHANVRLTALPANSGTDPMHLGIIEDITERLRAQQSLRISEERFRKVFENASLGIALANPADNRLNTVNDAMCRMFGYSREELTKLRIEDVTYPDDLDMTRDYLSGFVTGKLASCELIKRYRKKNGELMIAKLYASPIISQFGGNLAHFAIIEDITQRVRTEEAVRLNNERLCLAQRVGSFGVFDLNVQTGEMVVSPELERLYGVPAGSLTNRSEFWRNLVHPDDRARTDALGHKSIQEKTGGQMQFRFIHPDGSIRWMENTWSVLCDAKNQAHRVVGISMDITQRKFAADSLREFQERLSLAQEAAGIGVFEFDLVTQKLICTPELETLYGVAPGSFNRGTHRWIDYVHKDDLPRVQEIVAQAKASRTAGQMEYRVVWPDGTIRWISNIWRFVSEKDGQTTRAIGVNMDVTERALARESLLQHQDRLRRMASDLSLTQARERRELAQEIHDGISQDLAAAKLQLRMLEGASLPADSAELVNNAHQLIARAIERTRAVTFGLSPPALFELGLKSAVARLIEDLRKLYDLNIQFDRPAGTRKLLDEGPRVLVFRAIRELLMNVVKHARAKNAVVSIKRRGPTLVVSVADDGIGFDAKATELRDTFGLFSIREQIESLGGTLKIQSRPGKGTTVTLALPTIPQHAHVGAQDENQNPAG